jgi:hypothetical protein
MKHFYSTVYRGMLLPIGDAARTRIIGNFRFDYKASSLNCAEYPWYDRIFVKSHTQIECDPVVWDRVESLIRANLPPVTPSGPTIDGLHPNP